MIRNSIFARRIRELKICISDMEFDIYGLELYIKRSEIFFDKSTWEDPSQRPYDYAAWSQVRPFLRDLIRGKRVPVSFHFILHLKPEIMQAMLEKEGDNELISCVGAFVLTIRYKDGQVSLLSGISMKSFTMNKNADRLWDKTIRRFLEANEIAFELPG